MLLSSGVSRISRTISDNFNTNANPLTTTSSGHAWNLVSGSISASGGNGVFTPPDPNTEQSLAMAYVDAPYSNVVEVIAKDMTHNTGIVWSVTDNNAGFYHLQISNNPSQPIIMFGGKNPSTGAWQYPSQISYQHTSIINTVKIQFLKTNQYNIRYWAYSDSAMTNLLTPAEGKLVPINSYLSFSMPAKPKYGLLCFKNTTWYTDTVGKNVGDFSVTSAMS